MTHSQTLMLEELGGDDGTDRVASQIVDPGPAASVPVEAGQRVGTAQLKLAAQHVPISHGCSIAQEVVRDRGVGADRGGERPG